MGKVSSIFEDWTNQTKPFNWNRYNLYDENGKSIISKGEEWGKFADSDNGAYINFDKKETIEEHLTSLANESSFKDLNMIASINSGYDTNFLNIEEDNRGSMGGYLQVPTEEVLKNLEIKNKEGDYLLRNITLSSPNGTRISFIRNDKFDESNHKTYEETYKEKIEYKNVYYFKQAIQEIKTGDSKIARFLKIYFIYIVIKFYIKSYFVI